MKPLICYVTCICCFVLSVTAFDAFDIVSTTTTSFDQEDSDEDDNQPTCGKQTVQRLGRGGRVVGGQNSYPGEFPWTVSLSKLTATSMNFHFILTNSFCLYFTIRSRFAYL